MRKDKHTLHIDSQEIPCHDHSHNLRSIIPSRWRDGGRCSAKNQSRLILKECLWNFMWT